MKFRKQLVLMTIAATVALGGTADSQEASDLLPAATFTEPEAVVNQTAPVQLPATFTLTYDGVDPDGSTALPTKFRYLLRPAVLADGTYIETKVDMIVSRLEVASYVLTEWSSWAPWPTDSADRQITFENLPATDDLGHQIYYVLVMQVMDEMSAVSVDRYYGQNLAHFTVEEFSGR